ncbi:MAG: hypothetical protein V4613_01315 [Bacteroidota bacterium]
MKRNLFISLPVLLLVSFLFGCKSDNAEELYPAKVACDTANLNYNSIKPILVNNCLGSSCHNSTDKGGGYILEDYAGTLIAVNNNNKLLRSIKHDQGVSFMPKGAAKLSDCDIAKIEAWIKRGSPEN